MLYDRNGIYVGFDEDDDESLEHYGTPRHSGRYPWGSGDNPYQRNADFLRKVESFSKMKTPDGKRMFTDAQIAATMGINSTELRKRKALARAENWNYEFSEYKRLTEKGMSRSAIARRMGVPESTLRSWERQSTQETMNRYEKNANFLENRLKEVGGYLQVGSGTEYMLPNGSTSTTLNNSLKVLQNKGYDIHTIQVEQLGTGKMTTLKVLTMPGTTKKDVYEHQDKIELPVDVYEEDKQLKKVKPYVSVDPKRVMIKYNEDGGIDKDGLIEIRRNVPDLDIGRNHYVQGRILVDKDHYLKGMIAYAPDKGPDALPDGVDIRFNTNKHRGTPMINREDKDNSVLKPIKTKQDNIFGANIKPDDELTRAQRNYIGPDGKEHQSAINIVKEEGDVDKWSKNLASQFASKQPPMLAKQQLKILRDNAEAELAEISSYNNTVVKAKMLEDFAGRCESDAVHLQAAALPRQKTKFIMPLTNLKPNEAYVPGFKDGEQVALVRYPHGSITEIPIVTVNNNNKKAKSILGDAIDAIGINPETAGRLSGADFDGDTVLVLPTDRVKIKNKPQFESLKDFSTTDSYPGYEGMKRMTKHQKGVQMGVASNLITDMTIQGADDKEIERALKFSMVVIDAEKHGLDWKRAEDQLGIAALKKRYQPEGGPSTLLSRSTSDDREVPERKLKNPSQMSPDELERWKNGEQIYVNTGRKLRDLSKTYPKKLMTPEERAIENGNDKEAKRQLHIKMWEDGRAQDVWKNANEKPIEKGYLYDPYTLTSTGDREHAQRIEVIYADHATAMKDIARRARKEARKLEKFEVDKEAAKKYAAQVQSLKDKIAVAEANAPREKQAQLRAGQEYRKWLYDHPDSENDSKKRQKGIFLDKWRKICGAKKAIIGGNHNDPDGNPLTAKEWEAIQAHAINRTTLEKVIKNSDMQTIKAYAMPKTKTGIPTAKLARARRMVEQGYTRLEIAEMLDVPQGKLQEALEGL